MDEHHRKLFHMVVGGAFTVFGWLAGQETTSLVLIAILIFGMVLMNARLHGHRDPVTDFLIEKLDRTTHLPAKGAFFFALGALFALTFFRPYALGLGVLAIIAAGDGAATFIGIHGQLKLPHHPKKTWEGAGAFFAAGTIASTPFLGFPGAAFYSFLAAIVESLPIEIDDNLLIAAALWLVSLVVHLPLSPLVS